MTATRFEKLATFVVEHEYYRDAAGDLQRSGALMSIAPTPATGRALRDLGILFKWTEGGFVLLYEVADPAGSGTAPLKPVTGRHAWDFVIANDDPYLENYSDLPRDRKPDQFYHLTNRHTQTVSGHDPRRVSTGDFLGRNDLVQLRAARFSEKLSSPVTAPLVTVLDAWGEPAILERVIPVEGQQWLHADLAGRPAGRYTMSVEGIAEPTEFFVGPELSWPAPLGVVTLYAGPGTPDETRILDDAGSPLPKTFRLRINRRETVWRYYVALKFRTDADPAELSITSANPNFTFTVRGAVTKLGIETVIPFDSDATLLPYRSKPLRGVKLTKSTAVTPGALEIDDLPNPGPETLRADPDTGTLYSDTYIYI